MSTIIMALPGGPAILAVYRFMTSTIGVALIVGALAYGAGWRGAERRCDADRVRTELAAVRADLAAARSAEILARNQAADLEASEHGNREKVDALTRELKRRQGRHCGLSADDARRLRDIR